MRDSPAGMAGGPLRSGCSASLSERRAGDGGRPGRRSKTMRTMSSIISRDAWVSSSAPPKRFCHVNQVMCALRLLGWTSFSGHVMTGIHFHRTGASCDTSQALVRRDCTCNRHERRCALIVAAECLEQRRTARGAFAPLRLVVADAEARVEDVDDVAVG